MSPKLKFGAAVSVLVGLASLFYLQQQKINHLIAENAGLRSQLGEMRSVQDSDVGLAEQLKAAVAASQTNQNELLRLRGQGSRLRQLEQENTQLKSERQQLALQMRQSQAAVASSERGQVTAVTPVVKKADDSPTLDTTDLAAC